MNKFLVFLFLCCCAAANGLISIEKVEEGPCIIPQVDKSFDLLWIGEYVQWYFPIRSKYELYQWTLAVSGRNAKNVTEDMAERSCMILYIGGDKGATQIAFRGAKKVSFDSRIAGMGVFDWSERRPEGNDGLRGRSYITLTDSSKYFVSVSCWEKEQKKSYSVHSTTKYLEEDSKIKIKKHLQSLGFNVTHNLVETNYDNCYDYPITNIRKKHQAPSDNRTSPPNNPSSPTNPSPPSNIGNNPNNFGNNNPNNFNQNPNNFNRNPNNFNQNPNNFNQNPNNFNQNPNNFQNPNRFQNPNNFNQNPNNFGQQQQNNFGGNRNNPYDMGNNFGNNFGNQNRNPSPTNWFSNLIQTKIRFFSNLFQNLLRIVIQLVTSFIGGGGNNGGGGLGFLGNLFGGGNNNNLG